MVERPEDFLGLRSSLKEPGVTQVSAPDGNCRPIVPLKVDGISTLKELLVDYQFYTPALLHLTVPLTIDPFDVFCAEIGEDVQRYSLTFDTPLFNGLIHPSGDVTWNHALFCLSNEYFDKYITWIGQCAFNDSSKQLFRRIRTQVITILDPLAKLNNKFASPIKVTALVIESNVGSFYYKADIRTWTPQATFDASVVFEDTKAFGEAINKNASDPYGQVERETNARKDIPSGDDGR
jgi:hypothetical protein